MFRNFLSENDPNSFWPCTVFLLSVSGYAEVLDNRVVKRGVVKDELGEPLPAVTVVVKGTITGNY